MAVHAGDGRGMTASGDHDQVTEQIGGLLDHWTVGLAEVVASMAGPKREVSWEATAMPPGRAGPVVVGAAFPDRPGRGGLGSDAAQHLGACRHAEAESRRPRNSRNQRGSQ